MLLYNTLWMLVYFFLPLFMKNVLARYSLADYYITNISTVFSMYLLCAINKTAVSFLF